jgi:hypothetical protein
MATIELCDLCAGKAKHSLASIKLRGSIAQYKGSQPPPPPDGFKYNTDALSDAGGKISYEKVWDAVGRVMKETKYITPPKKWKRVEISYDLCENCFDKFCLMLQSIKNKYHLQETEIKLIEDKNYWNNPFLGLLGHNEDEDDD